MIKEITLAGVISASAFIPGANSEESFDLSVPQVASAENGQDILTTGQFQKQFDEVFAAATTSDEEAYLVNFRALSGEYIQLYKYETKDMSGGFGIKRGILIGDFSRSMSFPKIESTSTGITYEMFGGSDMVYESFNDDTGQILGVGELSESDLFSLAHSLTDAYNSTVSEGD